jgi:quinol monooxygenase YgiN
MLILIAQIDAKTGKEDLVADELTKLVEPSRAEEGCITYRPFRSTAPSTRFFVFEEWRSKEDLDTHTQTPHFRAFLDAAGDALDGDPIMNFVDPLE